MLRKLGLHPKAQPVLKTEPVGAVVEQPLLTLVRTGTVPAMPMFYLGERVFRDANIQLPIGDSYSRWDLMNTMVEDVPAGELNISQLERGVLDSELVRELGCNPFVSPAHFLGMIKAQSKGQEGVLLINGKDNIAYMRKNVHTLEELRETFMYVWRARWDSDHRNWSASVNSVADTTKRKRFLSEYRIQEGTYVISGR